MLVKKNRPARRVVSRALNSACFESLEQRCLMSAALTLVNTDGFPASDRMIFNTIQNLDPKVPNAVHNTSTLLIEDTGDQPLVLNSLVLSGPWQFVNAPAGGYNGTTVPVGGSLAVTLKFTQTTLPAHSYNETNFTNNVNGGAAIYGSLTINSNAPATTSKAVSLAGYWQSQSEHNAEPNLQTILNLVSGTKVNLNATPTPDLSEPNQQIKYYGSEVASSDWAAADTTQPVTVRQLASFHTEGNVVHDYWYSASTQAAHLMFTSLADEGQTLLPHASGNGNTAPLAASFTPNGAFGFRVDNEYSDDAINIAKNNLGGGGHHMRFFPYVDTNGNAVANTWIVAMDYAVLQSENFDFQDNVFLVTNMRPATVPPAPANLTATSGTAPALNWSAVSYPTLAGYNVYRSNSVSGPFTKLTATPTTTTSYTDNAAPGGVTLYYQVTAVDSASSPAVESSPASTSANTPGGPVTQPQSFEANAGQPVVVNVVSADTDTTGTIDPTTVTIVAAPAHGGTAVVDPSTGLVTYTSAAGFSGTESFSYTVRDNNGAVSSPATVTFTVTSAAGLPAPAADNASVTTLTATPVVINVLADTTGGAALDPTSVATPTGPANGNITINGDGTVTYTPNAGFIGGDQFTYTVSDVNGKTSNSARIIINVGVEISSARGANKIISYQDGSGATGIVTLNLGVADIFFSGTGTETVTRGKKIVVTGSSVHISSITASGTNAASTLLIRSPGKSTLSVGGITDNGVIGRIIAPTTSLTGVIDTSTLVAGGLGLLQLQSLNTGQVQVGNQGPASLAFIVGNVTDSDVNSSVPLRLVRAQSWLNTLNTVMTVSAPAVNALVVTGEFDANLDLTGNLGLARTGKVDLGFWNINGNARAIVTNSALSGWNVNVTGNLGVLNVLSGGLSSNVTAARINLLNVVGSGANLVGQITTTAGNLGVLHVLGGINGAVVNSAGDILNLVAGSMDSSTVEAGVASGVTLSTATVANLGSATIRGLHLTTHAGFGFSNSSVLAHQINVATLGSVNTANGGTPEGLAAVKFLTVTGTFNGVPTHLGPRQLTDAATLSSYLASKGVVFGDFEIKIAT